MLEKEKPSKKTLQKKTGKPISQQQQKNHQKLTTENPKDPS